MPQPVTGSECPHEAELLAYSLNRLPQYRREQFESHFVGCNDCRDFLALFARTADDATEHDIKPLTDSAIKNQASRILTYIKEDDFNRRQTRGGKQSVKGLIAGLFGSTRQLATAGLMVSAIAVGSVYFLTKGEPENVVAMEAIALATKDNRRIEPRLSGGLPFSSYPSVTRSSDEGQDSQAAKWQFDRAQSQVQFAEDASAPAEDRLALARVYLARGEADYTRRALAILEQLAAGPNPSAEVLNDTGVALYQLKRYSEAVDYFTRALEKAPSFEESLFNRALTKHKAGNWAEALEDWGRFIEVTSNEKWKEEAQKRKEETQRRMNMK
ncbi:MAG TPA: tetratricopeptide repeat protein [Blastocatellia bacterium]|nr:tetratricopeptide repeat protein [Blastocatellia bacterium]